MPRMARAAGVIAAALSLSVAAIVDGSSTAEAHTVASCRLVDGSVNVRARPDAARDARFGDYGDHSGQWVGADSTYSVALQDGSIAWIFSDTLYGTVTDHKLPADDSFFLNNSILTEHDGRLQTHVGGTVDEPESLVPTGDPNSWYWFGAGHRMPDGDLEVVALKFVKTGDQAFDFAWQSNQVALIDTDTWTVRSVRPMPSASGVEWGSWIADDHGSLLVYGVEDLGATKYLHIAKVLGHDLGDKSHWRYWDGAGWQNRESASVRVTDGVANEYSVTPYQDGYLLITQDTHTALSNQILAYRSCSPTGPFTKPVELYRMPETGPYGSYADPNIFGYNAHEHPELRDRNGLLVTYNVNSFDSSELYDDVTIYRPRFIRVDLTVS